MRGQYINLEEHKAKSKRLIKYVFNEQKNKDVTPAMSILIKEIINILACISFRIYKPSLPIELSTPVEDFNKAMKYKKGGRRW